MLEQYIGSNLLVFVVKYQSTNYCIYDCAVEYAKSELGLEVQNNCLAQIAIEKHCWTRKTR
jgi:hypothetical protein